MKVFKFQKNEIKKRISNIIKLTDFENKLSMSAKKTIHRETTAFSNNTIFGNKTKSTSSR